MAEIRFFLTNSEHIGEIEVAIGNLIFSEDDKKIYLDGGSGRICYDSIIVFALDSDRYYYQNPIDGFYFVEETKVLWRYSNGEWTAITDPPVNNVVFIPYSELPPEGDFAVLYICDKEFYIWNPTTQQYEEMNAESIWHEV